MLSHVALVNGSKTVTFTFGNANTPKGVTYARFRFSSTGSDSPTGIAADGEVEDYKITVSGPQFQNFSNALDVNNSGKVTPADALTVINYFNTYSALVGNNPIPLPPVSPPFPAPAPVLDPTGGGVPGQGLYLDVDGNTILSPNDALLVINYLNSQNQVGGEGEGGATDLPVAASPVSASVATTLLIPPVLIASPNVVIETRDNSTVTALAADQATANHEQETQDVALLALSASSSKDSLKLTTAAKSNLSLFSSDDSEWDDLLSCLASDQKKRT